MATTNRRGRQRLALALMLLALLLPLDLAAGARPAGALGAYTVTVTTAADTNNACASTGAGTCSLRDAVRFANAKNLTDPGASFFINLGTDFYDLAQPGTGEDNAATGDLDIRALVTIAGTGQTAINAHGIDRVFDVFPGAILQLSRLALTDGHPGRNADGGAIRNAGGLVLRQVVLAANQVTGGGRGGGIFSNGGLAIEQSSIVANFAETQAGGIYASGTLGITDSSIVANGSQTLAGGLTFAGTTGTLTHATVARNAALGTTGGVERTAGTLTLANTIVADNVGGNCAGAITNGGYNLDSGTTCGFGAAGGSLSGTDARLDPAGSDFQIYFPLRPDSPARDRVPAGARCTAADQRGMPRPRGGACDIGAYEFAAEIPLTLSADGGGTILADPAGDGPGPFLYSRFNVATLAAPPAAGQTFVGWIVDGGYRGWAPSINLTLESARTVRAAFRPTASFPDVPAGRADAAAIVALATRGTILGYADGRFGPDDGVQRAQMAALIARAMPAGPDTPPSVFSPPACTTDGSWDCEVWPNDFQDRGDLSTNLWRDVAALQHYGVARGYTAADCAARGLPAPCYAPTAPVSYAETVVFITRAMIAKGYWRPQPAAPQPYAGVPAIFATELATFHYYTSAAGGVPAPPADWNAGATRGWFARALWRALDTYWGIDGYLPDDYRAGGYVP